MPRPCDAWGVASKFPHVRGCQQVPKRRSGGQCLLRALCIPQLQNGCGVSSARAARTFRQRLLGRIKTTGPGTNVAPLGLLRARHHSFCSAEMLNTRDVEHGYDACALVCRARRTLHQCVARRGVTSRQANPHVLQIFLSMFTSRVDTGSEAVVKQHPGQFRRQLEGRLG
jgi:hypothetical protein